MKQFKGSVTHGSRSSHYKVRWDNGSVPLCTDKLFEVCNEMTVDDWNSSYTWGYEGHGSALLAITLLGFYGARSLMGNIGSHFTEGPLPKRGGTHEEQAAFVKKHYQAFASEVIANLPDNWTMTMEDIDKWVKEQENKPKEKVK